MLVGNVLYSSLLQWNASRLLGTMAASAGDSTRAARMEAIAQKIKVGIDAQLWSSERGMFMASTEIENATIDVWANAFAGASGFASEAQARAIYDYFAAHEGDIFFEGQVRQVPAPQHWAVAMGTYPPLPPLPPLCSFCFCLLPKTKDTKLRIPFAIFSRC